METSSSSLANQFQSLIRAVFLLLGISSSSVLYHAHPTRVWLRLLLSLVGNSNEMSLLPPLFQAEKLLSLSLSSYVPPIFLGDPLLQYFKVLLVLGSTKSATDSRCGLTSARSWGIIVSLDLLVTSADTAQHVAAPHAVPLHGVTASTFTIADLCVSLFLQPVNKVLVNARPAFHTFDCSGS